MGTTIMFAAIISALVSAQSEDAAPVQFAAAVAAPIVAPVAGDEWHVVVLVGFGAVIAVGLISSILLHWRCDGAGIEAGSSNPHTGHDAMHQVKYGKCLTGLDGGGAV